MTFRLASTDCEILKAIAECRLLTVPQVAALLSRSPKRLSTRIHELAVEGLLEELTRGRGQRRGRPERVLSLRERAVEVLKERGFIDDQVPCEAVVGDQIRCPGHQLLLNWARVHLGHVERILPRLSVRFLAHNSPFVPVELGRVSVVTNSRPVPGETGGAISFRPDATISISDAIQQKTVLFFLEVDLGTETVASPSRERTDVRQKILNYAACFESLAYKRYEKLWGCELRGFRLLFLTDTVGRLSQLCSLVREMAPSDFVWLAEKNRMFEDGISGMIWFRGGRLDASPQSILGSLGCRAPLS